LQVLIVAEKMKARNRQIPQKLSAKPKFFCCYLLFKHDNGVFSRVFSNSLPPGAFTGQERKFFMFGQRFMRSANGTFISTLKSFG